MLAVAIIVGLNELDGMRTVPGALLRSKQKPSRKHNTTSATIDWRCNTNLTRNESLYPALDVELLMKDMNRNGTSKRNASHDYNHWDGACETLGRSLPPRHDPVLVHVFYPFGENILDRRKKHLMILSFLATQCPRTSKLIVWHKEEKTPQMLSMPKKLLRRLEVRRFNESNIQEMGFASNTTQRLIREWKDSHKAGTTDIARLTILYNHGGIWVDSDSLLLRNLAPISGLSFIYQAQDDFLNGAIMGTASPKSPFILNMIQYIDNRLITNPDANGYYKWAMVMFNSIDTTGGEMPYLPGCLFDGGWFVQRWDNIHPVASDWDGFFGRKASNQMLCYIDPMTARFRGPLIYHWHGRWEMPIQSGSLGDCADRLYRKTLGIPFENSTLDDPQLACNMSCMLD